MAVETQANEPGFVPDAEALEAAAKASYEYEGDRREIDYLGWSDEPENVRRQWLQSVRLPVETYCAAAAPIVPAPAYGVKDLDEAAWGLVDAIRGADDGNEAHALVLAHFSAQTAGAAPVEEADAKAGEPVAFGYTNWRGEFAERNAIPLRIERKESEWHGPGLHWVMVAFDLEKQAERDFLIKDIGPASTIPSEPVAKGEAGAGPVGEAVPREATEMMVAAGNRELGFRYEPQAIRSLWRAMLAARPVEEPGEVEAVRFQRDVLLEGSQRETARADDAEAALAVTRERLEKPTKRVVALLQDLASERRAVPRDFKLHQKLSGACADLLAALSTQESSAALAGDGKEVGK